jgi:hypothetical protein
MAVAFDKNIGSGSSSMALSIAITVPAGGVAAGELVIVRVSNKDAATISSVTDTQGNTYTAVRAQAANGAGAVYFDAYASIIGTALVSGNTITVNFSIKASGNAAADAWSGVSSKTPTATNSGTGTSTAPSSGAASVTTAGDLAFGGEAHGANTTEPTNDADSTNGSWAQLTFAVGGGAPGTDGAYKITTGSGNQTYDETITSAAWCCQVAAFAAIPAARPNVAIVAPSKAAHQAANF